MFPDEHGKRYYTFDRYVKKSFGQKVVKIPLDGGFTCPNRDGTKSSGGCVFCAGGGGEAGGTRNSEFGTPYERIAAPLREQYEQGRALCEKKWGRAPTIVYFQSYTSTYAPIERLRTLYEEALSFEGVVGLTVATRADALPVGVLDYLEDLSTRTALTVELGLQSVFDETAKRINRGHTFDEFLSGCRALRARGIPVCVHLINGLPGESREMMLESAERVAQLRPQFVKFHELYIRRDAPLACEYVQGRVPLLSREEYISIVADQIERLPPDVVVERVTGDPQREALLAPLWALDKKKTLALLDRTLAARQSFQGICAK